MSGHGNTFSVIGADITINGDIEASTELHIDGKVEGDLVCASLVQGETSVIIGSVKAESARLAGRIEGSITAQELVILQSAQVTGDVHYDALTIEQGAEVEGHFAHRDPDKATTSATPKAKSGAAKDAAHTQGNNKPELLLAE